ncbi:TetR/AcrR family transcriptional regulator [Amycolatopsis cynarae]|uniref:TetR/AcrR family transcriptional regulator n=1 Tax=Amycolatopsis cynarae TaxID=2995223 RepID=A0ABY7AZD9_9PSEU|nr:TetR/AcrR family transcriptional regulator [Amycolatopsis sp. HUAS 11-8]WAL65404.1 TetR/AcrR family transcriptional regulator [Amycolatopsis sp. HUAS 11-8]
MVRSTPSTPEEANAQPGSQKTGYRRSTGSARGTARREELLDRVTDDLAAHGLVDFSLRRAARAAGTTHKVLLYHFTGADDLLAQAIVRLRARRIDAAFEAAVPQHPTLAARVRTLWQILIDPVTGLRVLDQAVGLAIYDPQRYAALGREASEQYLPLLLSLCPVDWPEQRKGEVAEMILAALRGFLIESLTRGETIGAEAGLEALVRALEREEAVGE